ncbi:adenylyltransferase and sulfurtransferase MOCS3 [Paramuricea clavata]|uniref:Adenylyltransferase and sulfurtransferase MOCS3 homolog n=1 Tax=Paramuricea clavata TaxID=317549 RepID=A0A6S7G5B0_PARCT|nr:adenylyltransferase and sulfurtransferase MOCS3 [Paramuricea clavata]
MADENEENIQQLREKLDHTTSKLNQMKQLLSEKGICLDELDDGISTDSQPIATPKEKKLKLTNSDIMRYSRQLVLPEIGVQGQLKLNNMSVLIVGAGGLGCPVAVYLTAAGIGHIGLVDYDDVELNNLHRQVLHSEMKVNWSKVHSARTTLSQLNTSVQILAYKLHLNSSNALELISKYDIVVDATDNVPTRYLLNDACVLTKKPLVSGSALRFDGQLTVYNYENGPCYRCLYPSPPPPETVGNCSENGVLGVVPGIIGNLQALEVIKIAVGLRVSFNQKLLLFDALDSKFTTIKLRGKQKHCAVCGDEPTINKLQDYEQFCGAAASDKTQHIDVLNSTDRISAQAYKKLVDDKVPHILLDVRPSVELEICKLSTSDSFLNIPIRDLENNKHTAKIKEDISTILTKFSNKHETVPVIAVCHLGNDSQRAVVLLNKILQDSDVTVQDITGGLDEWSKNVDPGFPRY